MSSRTYNVLPGNLEQRGAHPGRDGVNFCTFSRFATRIELLLFDRPDAIRPSRSSTSTPGSTVPSTSGTSWCRGCRRTAPTTTGAPPVLATPTRAAAATIPPRPSWTPGRRPTTTWSGARQACRAKPSVPGMATVAGDNVATAMRAQVVRDDYDWEGDDRRSTSRSTSRSSTRCTWPASPATPPPGCATPAPSPGSSRRSPICGDSASPMWNSCRSWPSTPRTSRPPPRPWG